MTDRRQVSEGRTAQRPKLGTAVTRAGEGTPQAVTQPARPAPVTAQNGWTIKPPEAWQTVADRLDALCDRLGARYERATLSDGRVSLAVELEDGTKVGGMGATTEAAFGALVERAKDFKLIDATFAKALRAAPGRFA